MYLFRNLRADEIDVRISVITATSLMLLLYKDARCDQNILDETVGPYNWQREHSRDNKNCTVSIYDEHKNMWVSKEDTGVESNSEAEKGLASDSFKRACFNWGIGRELYSSPPIWFPASECNVSAHGDKRKCFDTFIVTHIEYDQNSNIIKLTILNTNTNVAMEYSDTAKPKLVKKTAKKKTDEQDEKQKKRNAVMEVCKVDGINPAVVAELLHKDTFEQLSDNQIDWLLVPENWAKTKSLYNMKMVEKQEDK